MEALVAKMEAKLPGAWELPVVAAVLPYTALVFGAAMKIGTPLDNDNGPPDYHAMEARIAKLEAEVTAIKIDVAVIKLTCATKTDLAELKAELKAAISDGQTKIIVWVVSAIIFAQLLPVIKDSLTPSATVTTHAPAPRGR